VRAFIVAGLSLLIPLAASAEPVFLPGSRIGLTPPSDMAVSKRFTGFENPRRTASIALVEMPPEAYADVTAGFSKEALERQGITVMAREEIKVGGQAATLIAGELAGPVKLRKWVVAVADPGVTALVIAQSADGQLGYDDREMRDVLKSIALRGPRPLEEQVSALSFRLGDRAGFRPLRVLSGNALLLTDGPQDTVKEMEQPVVIIGTSASPVPPPGEARERVARAALVANQSLKEFEIERSQSFRQGGVDWHEIVARAKDAPSGRPVVVMQTIRFATGGYVRMVGVTRAEQRDVYLPRFRQVIDNLSMNES
jgi:hypothetical protein